MAGVIGGGLSLLGGIMGAHAAKSAASAQTNALNQALAFQQGVYGTAQTNLNPYISGGTNALAAINQLYGLPAPTGTNLPAGNALSGYTAYTKTPFYQFPLSQGLEALNRSGAARGLTLSGGQLNALQAYGQGYAGQNFGNYVGQLANLANLGQTSALGLSGAGNVAANNITGIQTGIGNAQAAGIVGAQNSINNALSQIGTLINPVQGYLGTAGGSSYGGGGGGGGGASSGNLSSALGLAGTIASFF